jgi:hypothetical protein
MMTPQFTGCDIARVFAVRDKICAQACRHVGTLLTGAAYEDLLVSVLAAIPTASATALRLSARALLDRTLTNDALFDFAWRMAGNSKALKQGIPVPGWGVQRAAEWMPLHVTSAQIGHNRKDESGHQLAFRVLAGTACPLLVRRFWTKAQAGFVSQLLGYNRIAGRPFEGAEHLVGLLLYGLFDPELSAEKPGFQQVYVPGTMLKHNVALIKGRLEKPCPTAPYHYWHDCDVCTIGYDNCPFALHPRTYTRGPCADCGEAEAVFDPDHPERCVACTLNRIMKEKEEK